MKGDGAPFAEKALVEEVLAAYCGVTARFVALQSSMLWCRQTLTTIVAPPHDDKEASKGKDEIKTDDRGT